MDVTMVKIYVTTAIIIHHPCALRSCCYIRGSERESLLDAHHQLAFLTPKWLLLDSKMMMLVAVVVLLLEVVVIMTRKSKLQRGAVCTRGGPFRIDF